MNEKWATLLYDIPQCPDLIPNHIPAGSRVEILRQVGYKDFYSGSGYVILWHAKYYADVVDASRLKFDK